MKDEKWDAPWFTQVAKEWQSRIQEKIADVTIGREMVTSPLEAYYLNITISVKGNKAIVDWLKQEGWVSYGKRKMLTDLYVRNQYTDYVMTENFKLSVRPPE